MVTTHRRPAPGEPEGLGPWWAPSRFTVERRRSEPFLAVNVDVPLAEGEPLGEQDVLVRLHSI